MKEFIISQLQNNEFFKGGFVLSIIAAIGMGIKQFIPWLWGRIERQISYSVRIENTTDLYYVFNQWLKDNHSDKYKEVLLFSQQERHIEENKDQDLKFTETNHNSAFIFWYNNYPVFLKSVREKFESGIMGGGYLNYYICKVYFKRSILTRLINFCVEQDNKRRQENKKNYIYTCDEYGNWNRGIEPLSKPYDKIFNNEKEILSRDIDNFISSKEKYINRGTPYRRGYLLYGMPGNGKTSTIVALAKKYRRDIYTISLKSLKNEDALNRAFQNIHTASFVLFEDIDSAVDGRNSIKEDISFGSFLNVLDGIFSKDEIITFFTSNHPEKLDDALKRCGRIDKKVEFVNPSSENVEDMLELFFDSREKITDYKENYSAAEIQEILISSKTASEALVKLESEKILT